jgi:NitT/TauT family transport system ATP-binding protein
MKPLIHIEHIHKTFKESNHHLIRVLSDITFDVHEGEFLVLLGPSGSGKSTLLRIACGLDTSSSGAIRYEPGLAKKDVNFVFQQSALLPWLTVGKNVEIGLIGRGVPESKREDMVRTELKEFGLEKFINAYPRELSGGMKQRVGLARAFVTEPKLIFLDEPFSELDFFTAKELRLELLRLWREHQATVIMVSHNITEAVELADRIAMFTARPGEIKKIMHNPLPRPRNYRSPEFFRMEDELAEYLKN